MANRMSDEALELLRLLKDGKWHRRSDITAKLVARVPPGRALRTYENREGKRAERTPRVGRELSDDEKIASGAKAVVSWAFKGLKANWLEFETRGDFEYVRRRRVPGRQATEIPADLEMDPPADEEESASASVSVSRASPPESAPVPAPTVAVSGLSEADVRTIVREETERVIVAAYGEIAKQHQEAMSVTADQIGACLGEFAADLNKFFMQRFAALEKILQEKVPKRPPSGASPLGLPDPRDPYFGQSGRPPRSY